MATSQSRGQEVCEKQSWRDCIDAAPPRHGSASEAPGSLWRKGAAKEGCTPG